MIPILNPTVHKQVLDEVLVQSVLDEENSWALNSNGSYTRLSDLIPKGRKLRNAHEYFVTHESLSGRSSNVQRLSSEEPSFHFKRGQRDGDSDI